MRARMIRRVVRSTRVPTAEPLREVAFPVARHSSCGDFYGTIRNRRHVRHVAASIGSSRPRPACFARLRAANSSVRRPPRGSTYRAVSMLSAESRVRMSSGYACRRRPAICSGEHPWPRWVRTYGQSHGSRSLRGSRGCESEPLPAAAGLLRNPACLARVSAAPGAVRAPQPTPWPSSATIDLGPGLSSGFHVLRHSCVHSNSWTWQHRSPSGPAVVHSELELKKDK